MWRTSIYMIILIFLSGSIFAGKGDEYFTKGNAAYEGSRYEEAIAYYDSIVSLNLESSALYFNLGNAYYKRYDFPRAILYYEKALKLDPGDDDISRNLDLARKHIQPEPGLVARPVLERLLMPVLKLFRSNIWAVLSLVFFILALGFLLFFFLSLKVSLKRMGFYTGIALLLISLSSFLLARYTKRMIVEPDSAIVIREKVDVKADPKEKSQNLESIRGGTKVLLLREDDDWYEVRYNDNDQGWVRKSDIEII